jgi:hypothetical protein
MGLLLGGEQEGEHASFHRVHDGADNANTSPATASSELRLRPITLSGYDRSPQNRVRL